MPKKDKKELIVSKTIPSEYHTKIYGDGVVRIPIDALRWLKGDGDNILIIKLVEEHGKRKLVIE